MTPSARTRCRRPPETCAGVRPTPAAAPSCTCGSGCPRPVLSPGRPVVGPDARWRGSGFLAHLCPPLCPCPGGASNRSDPHVLRSGAIPGAPACAAVVRPMISVVHGPQRTRSALVIRVLALLTLTWIIGGAPASAAVADSCAYASIGPDGTDAVAVAGGGLCTISPPPPRPRPPRNRRPHPRRPHPSPARNRRLPLPRHRLRPPRRPRGPPPRHRRRGRLPRRHRRPHPHPHRRPRPRPRTRRGPSRRRPR